MDYETLALDLHLALRDQLRPVHVAFFPSETPNNPTVTRHWMSRYDQANVELVAAREVEGKLRGEDWVSIAWTMNPSFYMFCGAYLFDQVGNYAMGPTTDLEWEGERHVTGWTRQPTLGMTCLPCAAAVKQFSGFELNWKAEGPRFWKTQSWWW